MGLQIPKIKHFLLDDFALFHHTHTPQGSRLHYSLEARDGYRSRGYMKSLWSLGHRGALVGKEVEGERLPPDTLLPSACLPQVGGQMLGSRKLRDTASVVRPSSPALSNGYTAATRGWECLYLLPYELSLTEPVQVYPAPNTCRSLPISLDGRQDTSATGNTSQPSLAYT